MNNKGKKNISALPLDILFKDVFKQLHAPLFFYALKFVDNQEAAKDLVQDAFFSILNTCSKTEIENLKSYLYHSVRNNCLNFLKHKEIKNQYFKKEMERAEREIEFYDMHQTLVEKELLLTLNRAIDELPEHYKIPFKLSRFEELKNKEIAEKLGLPLRTIETKIYRALILVREKLKGQAM